VGSRVLIARVVARLCASYLVILLAVLLVLDAAAFWYLGRSAHDALEPALATPEGAAAYGAQLRRIALGLGLLDVPLLLVSGAASYALAVISVRPLVQAREREARFAADAAHELRTPLARIAGVAQSARGTGDGTARDEALQRIAALAIDASGIVGDLLALMRDEHVAPRLSEPVDVGAVVRRVVGAMAAGGPRCELDVAEACWVVGDERRLRRLVENLVDNANRHARAIVRVRVIAEGEWIALSVEDDGPGVPAALREHVFDRFVRAADDETGSGLGLAICRAIARAHGGEVALEERSRFIARLPRAA
jgi:signal transduction histidine kinase